MGGHSFRRRVVCACLGAILENRSGVTSVACVKGTVRGFPGCLQKCATMGIRADFGRIFSNLRHFLSSQTSYSALNSVGSSTSFGITQGPNSMFSLVCSHRFASFLRLSLLTLITAIFLTACGGGGGSSSNPTPTAPDNPNPTVTSVTPSSAVAGGAAITVTVNGTGFISGSTVQWNQSNRATTFVSATQLQAAITAADLAAAGTAQVTVVNGAPGGGTSAATAFTINNPAPQVTSVSPASVTTVDAGSTLTVNGSGFVSTSSITWNGTPRTTTFVSATQLQAKLVAADLSSVGSAQVAVTNPAPGGGTATAVALAIVYPVPVINSLSPTGAAAGGQSFNLTVIGVGFGPTSVVQVNGSNRPTQFVNSTTLRIGMTASDIASPATIAITVVTGTPGGGTSAPFNFTVANFPVPAITSINPTAVTVNSPDTAIGIQGSGFTQLSTIQVGGSTFTPTSFSPSFLFFTLPAANLTTVGQLSITVSNPGTSASNAVTFTVNPNPVPVLSSLTPNSAAAGGAAFTLTLFGSNFVPASVVQWNGSPRSTTFSSSSQLTAKISASDVQTLGTYSVTVVNPTPGGGASNALGFTTYLPLPANDLVYSSSRGLLYASVPSAAGPTLGNSIVPIDPYTGVLGTPIFVGSEPGKIALSSDGSALWVALNGAGAVRKVDLTNQTAGLQFSLGIAGGFYNPPNTAQALAVMPGHPDTVAVAGHTGNAYQSLVTIYDSGAARTNASNGAVQCCSGVTGLAFDSTGTKLYEAGSGYGLATVDSTGITSATSLNANVSTNSLQVDNGHAYLTTGVILDANLGTQLGVFSVGQNQNANGPVVSDSGIGEAFVLVNPNFGSAFQVNVYDNSTFVLKGNIPVGVSNTCCGSNPSSLVRWGQDGLAFIANGQLYILRSSLVRDLSSSLADLSVTAGAPSTAATGADITYNLTVSNAGPVTAAPATLIDNIPDGSTFKSVTASQGSCSGGAVVRCNLGNVSSGSSATVQIVVTALASGTLTDNVSVAAPQGDSNISNNTASATTAVSGNNFNPSPALATISPAFVQAGAASFTLTVNGSGFASSSTVQLNGTALPTTFVNASQLTATVDSSNVASLGWGWVNVSSPSPGGGTSSSLPLSVYQVLSLDVNRLTSDPFTRKLFASIPSTATQVTGNSLVAIDPAAASIGAPLNIGSEPDRLAESVDGKYLYIGLDGSKSVTRMDLTTMTKGAVYPVNITSFGSTSQVAPRDLAVNPGSNDLLAIDTGSFSGIGLFDISGSTMTQRQNLTSPYTGSNLAFANASTLYSYDSDTSGAQFNIWTVTNTGLTLNNNTGYTLNGIGGFSGAYRLANGIVYGFGGGVADPRSTPPVQLGQFNVGAAQGNGQSIQGTGVAPDPAIGRVFITGETLAGSANPVLFSFDPNTFELVNMQQFTGAAQAQDLVRWGRDGLAWHSSLNGAFGTGTPGKGQLFLVRGPFVLPAWAATNPVPGLTSVSPSSAGAGSNITLSVAGSNFVPGAVLLWNGAERTTTFVDSSHLTVAIPASDLGQSGSATLVVNNPGSANSSSVSFTIN